MSTETKCPTGPLAKLRMALVRVRTRVKVRVKDGVEDRATVNVEVMVVVGTKSRHIAATPNWPTEQ